MVMPDKERRHDVASLQATMQRGLSEAQKMTLAALEPFGWELKFVRKPMFQAAVPVVFDGDRKKFSVLEPDGSLNENPGFAIRE
jgi:hypothetical protein